MRGKLPSLGWLIIRVSVRSFFMSKRPANPSSALSGYCRREIGLVSFFLLLVVSLWYADKHKICPCSVCDQRSIEPTLLSKGDRIAGYKMLASLATLLLVWVLPTCLSGLIIPLTRQHGGFLVVLPLCLT